MVAWWIIVLINIGLTLLYELVRPKPKFDSPEPSALGDFQFPTVGEGRVIPLVWGTCKIAGPMVTWYGDLDVQAMKKRVRTGLFSWDEVTTNYRYSLGMQLVLCSGEIDEVIEIRFDDRPTTGTTITPEPASSRTKVHIDALSFFGGDEEEGGLEGDLYIYHGTGTQNRHPYLQTQLGTDIPAARHVCYVCLDQMYLGTTPYIEEIAIVLRRCPNSLELTGGDENIAGDANPAAIIYELFTRSPGQNGLGVGAGFIDVDSFRTVGATLADEEMGLSMIQDRATPARDLILEMLRHIDGVVYVEPSTGLIKMGLIRADYVFEELPVLNEDNCTVTDYGRASWGEVKNQIRVAYVDRADGFIEKTVQAQDLAALEASGGEVSTQDLQYRGFSNATAAQQACARALMGLSYPLASIHINGDRSAWSFRPGTPFRLDWPKLGISGMVCRVLRLGSGELISGVIQLEVVEDIFSIAWTGYTAPASSGWVDPAGPVPALTDQAALLAPHEAVWFLKPPDGGVQRAVVMAARGEPGISKGFSALVDATGDELPFFTPSGLVDTAIDELSTTIEIAVGPDWNLVEDVNEPDYAVGANVAWIYGGTDPGGSTILEEFIAFRTINVAWGIMTLQILARGCLDTAPTSFATAKRVWIMSYGNAVINVADSGITDITFQPYNNRGALPLGSCIDSSVTAITPRRADRVYCPTDLLINGEPYPSWISQELTVSWEHRNRLGTWSYADSGETAEPEPGTEYDVLVYGELGTLIHTEPGITGKSWTYLIADEISDSGLGRLNDHLKIVLKTYGDSRSHQAFRDLIWEFDRPFPSATATGIGTASGDLTLAK